LGIAGPIILSYCVSVIAPATSRHEAEVRAEEIAQVLPPALAVELPIDLLD
jgi:hypothetical protein